MKTRARLWSAECALCLLVLSAYANSFRSGFVFDNRALLLEDPRIQQVSTQNLDLIFSHTYWWPRGESGLYRPLTTLSYLFNNAILANKDHPAGYHWINLLLHAGNVLLIFALARRLLGRLDQSFLIAAVWAVHPVLTESVTNIVGRADLLAGMATTGGLLLYLQSLESHGLRRAGLLAALAAVTAVGVFSKESAVAVVGIIALYELTWWNPRRIPRLLLACLAMAPAIGAMLWARSKALAASPPVKFPFVDNPIVGAGFMTGRLTAVKVLAKYLGLLIWPAHLSADYSYRQIPLATGSLTDWVSWIVIGAVTITTCLLYKRNKVAFFAVGFAFLTILPASNLILPVGAIMAERFLYLAAAGFAMCLVGAIYALAGRIGTGAAVPAAACLLVTSAFTARTLVRNADWRDNLTLWSATTRTSPLSFKPWFALAASMHPKDYSPGSAATDTLIEENDRSLAILDPLPDKWNTAVVYYTTASEYAARGFHFQQMRPDGELVNTPESTARLEKARALLLRAISISEAQYKDMAEGRSDLPGVPGDRALISRSAEASGYLMLSETDQHLKRLDDALDDARHAQALDPARGDVYARVDDVLLALNRGDEGLAIAMEGWLLTAHPGLQKNLLREYADRPADMKCAISYAGVSPTIDFSCAAVRREICAVSGDALRIAAKIGGDTPVRLKRDLVAKYGCNLR